MVGGGADGRNCYAEKEGSPPLTIMRNGEASHRGVETLITKKPTPLLACSQAPTSYAFLLPRICVKCGHS